MIKGSPRDKGSSREEKIVLREKIVPKNGSAGKTDSHHLEAIEATACLGKIVTHQRLENGGYQLLMLGMRRLRIVRELVGDQPFRRADVELLDDHYCADDAEERAALQTALTHTIPTVPSIGQFSIGNDPGSALIGNPTGCPDRFGQFCHTSRLWNQIHIAARAGCRPTGPGACSRPWIR